MIYAPTLHPHTAEASVKPCSLPIRDPSVLAAGSLPPSRAIYVGTSGNYDLTYAGDSVATTTKSMAAGVLYPFTVTKIEAEGGGPIAAEGDVLHFL